MTWTVGFHQDFEPEFDRLPEQVQDELLAEANLSRGSDQKPGDRTWIS
jgi:hypothetical protein